MNTPTTYRSLNDFGSLLLSTIVGSMSRIVLFIPQLIAAIIILIVGAIVASFLRTVVRRGLRMLGIDRWLMKAGVEKKEHQDVWANIFAQLVYWSVLLAFLVPAMESLGVPRITAILDQLLAYIPNIFAAVVIGFIGMIISHLLADIIRTATGGVKGVSSDLLANIARWAVVIFTTFIVLDQLNIAANLIQILFSGLMVTLALGIGLAIGLGGQEFVRDMLSKQATKLPRK